MVARSIRRFRSSTWSIFFCVGMRSLLPIRNPLPGGKGRIPLPARRLKPALRCAYVQVVRCCLGGPVVYPRLLGDPLSRAFTDADYTLAAAVRKRVGTTSSLIPGPIVAVRVTERMN